MFENIYFQVLHLCTFITVLGDHQVYSAVILCHPSNVNTLANSELCFLIISRTPNRLKPWAICSIMAIFGSKKLFSNRDLQARIGSIIIWLTFLGLQKVESHMTSKNLLDSPVLQFALYKCM